MWYFDGKLKCSDGGGQEEHGQIGVDKGLKEKDIEKGL